MHVTMCFFYFQDEPITFNEDAFITHKSNTMRQFLQNATQLQLFKEVRKYTHMQFCMYYVHIYIKLFLCIDANA